jgi:hypothetical protein
VDTLGAGQVPHLPHPGVHISGYFGHGNEGMGCRSHVVSLYQVGAAGAA